MDDNLKFLAVIVLFELPGEPECGSLQEIIQGAKGVGIGFVFAFEENPDPNKVLLIDLHRYIAGEVVKIPGDDQMDPVLHDKCDGHVAQTEALDSSRARQVLEEMVHQGIGPQEAMQALGVEAVDRSQLDCLCRELIEANPRIVADVKAGKDKAVGALIGQARKRNPNANPNQVRELCLRLIREL